MIQQFDTIETTLVGPFQLDSDEAVLRIVHSEPDEQNFDNTAELVALVADFLVNSVPAKVLNDVINAVADQLASLDEAQERYEEVAAKAHRVDEIETSIVDSDITEMEQDPFTSIPTALVAYECETARLHEVIGKSDEAVNEELAAASSYVARNGANGLLVSCTFDHPGNWPCPVCDASRLPKTMCGS